MWIATRPSRNRPATRCSLPCPSSLPRGWPKTCRRRFRACWRGPKRSSASRRLRRLLEAHHQLVPLAIGDDADVAEPPPHHEAVVERVEPQRTVRIGMIDWAVTLQNGRCAAGQLVLGVENALGEVGD